MGGRKWNEKYIDDEIIYDSLKRVVKIILCNKYFKILKGDIIALERNI